MLHSYWRGNKIIEKDGKWYYEDDTLVKENIERRCGNCNEEPTSKGHDFCINGLIGTMNACCGHGNIENAYIQFLDGWAVHGEDAVKIQEILKKYKVVL